jgi:uncharacterized protein (TIGR03435 family)
MKRLVLGCVVCLIALGQPRPAFEVASVRASGYQGGPLRVTERVDADGINFTNATLRMCIQRAFGLKPYQLVGPDLMDRERFVINAKAGGPASREKLMEMLQTLLVERFKLVFHRDTREIPVYALVVGKNGLKLKEAAEDEGTQIDGGDGDDLVFQGVPMGMLTGVLANSLDRPVFDETGLKGKYNFSLAWAERRRKGATGEAASPDAPSIFTALQERLGLKLEAKKAPVEMFVVDRLERPSEN